MEETKEQGRRQGRADEADARPGWDVSKERKNTGGKRSKRKSQKPRKSMRKKNKRRPKTVTTHDQNKKVNNVTNKAKHQAGATTQDT